MSEADRQGEFIVRLCFRGLALGCSGSEAVMCLISLVYSVWKYGKIDVAHLYRPYKTRYGIHFQNAQNNSVILFFSLPWDQNVFSGWSAESIYYVIMAVGYFVILTTFLSFFITICLYHGAIGQIFSNFIDDVDKVNSSHRLHIKIRLRDAVHFHTSPMQ